MHSILNIVLKTIWLSSLINFIVGKLPSVQEYLMYSDKIQSTAQDTFRYLNFDKIPDYVKKGENVNLGTEYASTLKGEISRLDQLAGE